MEGIEIQNYSTEEGFWLMGWLFTIGFLRLTFWKGVLALFIWPYYLGVEIAKRLRKR